jgi:hypothetical protein
MSTFELPNFAGITMPDNNLVPDINADALAETNEHYKALRDGLLDTIRDADEDALAVVKNHIRSNQLDLADRERMIKAVQTRQDELTGIKVPLAGVRQELAGPSRLDQVNGEQRKPEWCEPWFWIENHNCFYNIVTNNMASIKTFDMKHSRDVPDITPRPQATLFVSQYGLVPTVVSLVYLPTEPDKLVLFNGDHCVNIFDRGSLPAMAVDYTDAGNIYLDLVEAHIKMVCGTAANARIMTQWLAHQVQYPGRKILWAPLVQSVEGVGKSFFARLLRCGLGVENVGVVNPEQLTSSFNQWAGGVCVNVLEELKIAGHNRYEALNAVKPLITDDFIQVNPKGISAYTLPNVTNYMALTNSMDALPLGGADRRWWVIQCLISHYTDVPDYENYYRKLFDGLLEHAAEVCLWLREYQISDEFMNMKQAPMTDAKALMVATEEASFEGLTEAKDIIAEGGYLISEEVLSSADVFDKLKFEHFDLVIHTHRRSQILKRLGYQAMGQRVRIGGKLKQFWSKGPVTAEEIKAKWPEELKEVRDFPIVEP